MPNHIINKHHSQLDFVNILTNKDVALFIDPTKLHSQYLHPLFKDGSKKLHSFFLEVYRVYTEEGDEKARQMLRHSSECNYVHLGYSANKSRGTGASEKMLFDFFQDNLEFREGRKGKTFTSCIYRNICSKIRRGSDVRLSHKYT